MMIMDDVKSGQKIGFRVRVKFENLQDKNTFYVYINPTVIQTVTDFINKIREFFCVEEKLTLTCNNCVLTSKDDINVLRDEDLVIVCSYFPPPGSSSPDNSFFHAQSFSCSKNFCKSNASGREFSDLSDQLACSTSCLRNIGSPNNVNGSRSVYNIVNNANSARIENSSLPVRDNNVSRTGSRSDAQPLVVLAELASEHDAPGLNAAAAAAVAVSTRIPALGRSPQTLATLYDATSRMKNLCSINDTCVPSNIPISAAETTSWNYNVRVIDCPNAVDLRNSKATVGTGGTVVSTIAASSHTLSLSQNVALSNQSAQNDTVTLPSASLENGVPRMSTDVEFLSENSKPDFKSRCNERKAGKDQPVKAESAVDRNLSAISGSNVYVPKTNRDHQQAIPVSLSDDDTSASVVTVEDDSSITEVSNRDCISDNGFPISDVKRLESRDDSGSVKRKHADVDEQRHDDEKKRRKMFSLKLEDDVGKADDSDEFCECVTASTNESVCPTTFQKNSLQTDNPNIAELNGKNLIAVTPSSTKLFESAALVVNDSLGVRKKRIRKRKRKNKIKGNNEQFASNVPSVKSPVLITPGFSGVHIRFDSDSDSPSDCAKNAGDIQNCLQENTLVGCNGYQQPSDVIFETISNSSTAISERPSDVTSVPRTSTPTPPVLSEWSDKSKQDNRLLEQAMFETTIQNLMAFKDFPITPSYSLKFQVNKRSTAPASTECKYECESTSTSSSQNNDKSTTSVRLSPTPVNVNQRQRRNISESQNDAKTFIDGECERSDGSSDPSGMQNGVKLTFTAQNITLMDASPRKEHDSLDTLKLREDHKMTVVFTGSKAEVIDNKGSVILSVDIDKAVELLPLHTNPEVGDVITFYILKLDSNVTPTVSGVICGEVISIDGDNLKLKTLYGKEELNKPASTSHILFECGGDDATSDFNEMKVDVDGIVELRWSNMLNARLVTRL